MPNLKLQINTPDASLYSGETSQVTLPTTSGQQAFLANHWDSIVQLEVGIIELLDSENTRTRFAINGGVATFKNNTLIINTIEGEAIRGRKPDLKAFPNTLKLKAAEVQEKINQALKEAGIFDENKEYINSLMAEERIAKVQLLNEIIRGN
jgi:F0F1-type ATP synthase epsilon subunit